MEVKMKLKEWKLCVWGGPFVHLGQLLEPLRLLAF